jgi:hypothetical protein
MLAYKNQREKAVDTVKKREDEARRIEELRQQIAYESRQTREREKPKSGVQIGIEERQMSREVVVNICRREANFHQSRQPSVMGSFKRM